jgi:ligand-binding SRPBCC domain-containing protein
VIRFAFSIDVARPVHDVFEYVSDPANLQEWQGTAEVVQLTQGPVREGTRFREVHERMGRRLESVTEVAAYEQDRRFDVRIVEGPLPVDGRWNFEPIDGGTRLRFAARGQPTGAMRLFEPLLARVLRRQMRRDHARLKQALESRA